MNCIPKTSENHYFFFFITFTSLISTIDCVSQKEKNVCKTDLNSYFSDLISFLYPTAYIFKNKFLIFF